MKKSFFEKLKNMFKKIKFNPLGGGVNSFIRHDRILAFEVEGYPDGFVEDLDLLDEGVYRGLDRVRLIQAIFYSVGIVRESRLKHIRGYLQRVEARRQLVLGQLDRDVQLLLLCLVEGLLDRPGQIEVEEL